MNVSKTVYCLLVMFQIVCKINQLLFIFFLGEVPLLKLPYHPVWCRAVEQAADRVFMAARLFVRLFNQRGASLQKRILEMLAQADAADYFHKRTVSAAVGGGVASVAGSVATITGLILAPFTFGASIIVTAVGIGVATAGSITSATANITDTVHSNMDLKKVEKMIQSYQEEIKDIRECLEFVEVGGMIRCVHTHTHTNVTTF